jgi:hypothetical protein
MLLFSTSSLRLGVWWVIPDGLVCEIGRPYLQICPPKNFSWDVVVHTIHNTQYTSLKPAGARRGTGKTPNPGVYYAAYIFMDLRSVPSSWAALPGYGPNLNRNILDFMK